MILLPAIDLHQGKCVRLFRGNIGPEVKIKAAGGIRTREALEAFLAEGCDRVGASCAVELLKKK